MSLIVPIYSMRSYEDGKYAVLKDGNFQLHLHRMDIDNDIIAVPHGCSDLEDLRKFFPNLKIMQLTYGENAYDTRKKFWKINFDDVYSFILNTGHNLITDITGLYDSGLEYSYNMNISYDKDNPRSYIDEFYFSDLKTVDKSIITTVLNHSQKETMVNHGISPDKIQVNQRVLNPKVLEVFMGDVSVPDITDGIFFPFRISDPCYDFDSVILEAKKRDMKLYITDPNNSYDKNKLSHFDFIELIKPNKEEYYSLLAQKPVIVYNENPEKVFHPGLAELIYFQTKLECKHKLPSLEDILV